MFGNAALSPTNATSAAADELATAVMNSEMVVADVIMMVASELRAGANPPADAAAAEEPLPCVIVLLPTANFSSLMISMPTALVRSLVRCGVEIHV